MNFIHLILFFLWLNPTSSIVFFKNVTLSRQNPEFKKSEKKPFLSLYKYNVWTYSNAECCIFRERWERQAL